ncbi:hypothetical protein QE152_g32064 [Popillia japonica]|uniref:Uncharacterized protein n=1 Tax=Popillia japonica TaxID=7064 RepID=A0AAW1J0P3_POPJA
MIVQSSNKSRTLWNLVNRIKGKSQPKQQMTIKYNNQTYTNPKDIADIFGNYFSTTVLQDISLRYGPNITTDCTLGILVEKTMFFQPVTGHDIQRIINRLPNKKSTGLDEVSIGVLKQCSKEVSQHLADIINVSISSGVFPTALKSSAIIPIYKKDDPAGIINVSISSGVFPTALKSSAIYYTNL